MLYKPRPMLRPLYCFGAAYLIRREGRTVREFRLVKPSGPTALPYVFFDAEEARRAFRLVEHHAHLYYTKDCHNLELIQRGADFHGADELLAPLTITVPRALADSLFAALAAAVRDAHEVDSTHVPT